MAETLEQKMCKRSLGYAFVRNVFVRPMLYLFYRKVDVIGAETVPDTGPVIFAPNHQNALMDALVTLCTKNRQPVFVARADIFRKPIIIAVLHFLRILPIYRKRDGGNSSDNNQETFDILHQVLLHGQAVGIMPEGTHNEIKRLRILQKGIFRLAMQVQENYGTRPVVKIVPVGLEYVSTNRIRTDVIVNYGKALEVSDFYDLYVENPAKAFKHMQDALSEKMKEGMVDIENETCYSEIERIRVYYLRQAMQRLGLNDRNASQRLSTQQKIIATMQNFLQTDPEAGADLCAQIKDYTTIIRKHNFDDRIIERQPYSFLGLAGQTLLALTGIPLYILGLLLNYPAYLGSRLGSRNVKDPQFVSSVQFVVCLVLFPLYHIIMAVLFVVFIPCIWGKLTMIILLIPSGLFAYEYGCFVKRLYACWRIWNGKRKKDPEILKAVELRKNIFAKCDKIIVG